MMGNATEAGSRRFLVLIGAIVVQLILGTVYGYSIFWQPLQSEVFPTVVTTAQAEVMSSEGLEVAGLTIVEDEEAMATQLAKEQGYLKYAFSLCILSFAFTMVIAGRIQDITGPRLPALVGATLMGLGFLIAGLMSNPMVFFLAHAALVGAVTIVLLMAFYAIAGKMDVESPIMKAGPLGIVAATVTAGVVLGGNFMQNIDEFDKLFLIWGTIGVLAGMGIGFAYVCPLAALVKWFPEHKGLVSGLAVAGFGFGAFIFKGETIGAFGYIQEHGIRPFFLVHALICFVGVSLGAFMLSNPPAAKAPPAAADSTWQDTLRKPAFYVLWLMFFSGAMAGLMVIGIVKDFAGEQLVAAATGELSREETLELMAKGTAAVGWLAIFNAVGRVAWGFISDKIGRTSAFVAMFVLQAITMFMLMGMQTELMLAIAASAVGFNFGGNFALFPSATADRFGAKNMGANYGWVFTSYGIAAVVGIAAGNAAKTMTGSYGAGFIVAGILCLASAGLAVGLQITSKKEAAPA